MSRNANAPRPLAARRTPITRLAWIATGLAIAGPIALSQDPALTDAKPATEKPEAPGFGYYNDAIFYPASIDPERISVKFPSGTPDEAIRGFLSQVTEVDASKLAVQPISEDRWIEAPLVTGLNGQEALDVAIRLDIDPGLVFAAPYFTRTGEKLGLTNDLMLSFKKGVTDADARAFFRSRGLTVVESLGYVEHGYQLTLPKGSGRLTIDEARELYELDLFEWVVPNFMVERVRRLTPNDTYFQYQWHLHNTGQSGATADADIDAVEAWDVTRGSTGITIAIVDDGVETAHEDLSPNMVTGWDFLSGDSNPNPGSGDSHGTAVAGCAGARGQNAKGVSGVAHLCKIMPIRLVGIGQSTSKEANAFNYAANNGADVINNSWGPPDGTGQTYPLPSNVKAAIDFAADTGRNGKGCVIFWAAGNGNENANLDGYAAYSKVVSVAASTDFNQKAPYSDFGSTVDVCAPSSGGTSWGIITTDRSGTAGYSSFGYASGFGGTSAASPIASGVGALVLSVDPALTRQEVYNILTSTADKIDPAGGAYNGAGHSNKYGYGKVNAKAAVDAAVNGSGGGPGGGGGNFVSFSSGDVPKNIPDNSSSGTFATVNVSGMSGNLTDFDVDVNIAHTYKGDLLVYLQKPDNSYILMHNKTGGGANNIITTYDTQTTPTQPLSNLFGGSPNGTWRLWAFDQAAQDTGSINGVTLHVKTDAGGGGGGPTTKTYNASDLPKNIPDNTPGGVNSFLTVAGQSGNITEVNISVNITHTYKGDLWLRLYYPGGSSSALLHNNTGGSANNIITTYDTLTAPANSLATFNGKSANGQWFLKAVDSAAQDIGTINSWSLEITTQ